MLLLAPSGAGPQEPVCSPGGGAGSKAGYVHQAELPPVHLQSPTANLTHPQLVLRSDTSQQQAIQKGDTESPPRAVQSLLLRTFRMRSPSCKELRLAASPLSTMCLMKSWLPSFRPYSASESPWQCWGWAEAGPPQSSPSPPPHKHTPAPIRPSASPRAEL